MQLAPEIVLDAVAVAVLVGTCDSVVFAKSVFIAPVVFIAMRIELDDTMPDQKKTPILASTWLDLCCLDVLAKANNTTLCTAIKSFASSSFPH